MHHDHRDLARDMGLIAGDPLVGAGLPLWLPAGAVIRHELEGLGRETALATGCSPVYSPVLGKRALFERSGHWDKFADDMFPAMAMGGPDAEDLVLRPANCPHHAMLYAAEQHSYRDLPIRYHELAPMFRAERSGVVSGLSRVRQINLDDTHVFARTAQIGDEVALALAAGLDVLGTLGVEVSHVRLSRRDDGDRWLGEPERWADAESQLREATSAVDLAGRGIDLQEVAGEAAFYGPKLDVQVRDAAGREETISTVQLDFGQPERFDLTCIGPDGGRERVVMIHRGLIGSMERMVALLLEVHDGRLPIWLAPVQVCVLPVSEAHEPAAAGAASRLAAAGLRVRVESGGSLGRRLRASRRRRDALLAVLGSTEAAGDSLAVHDPATDSRAAIAVDEKSEA
ncbi:aminoacyl--tRNA ligase-related protein, partial [Pseudactinotalea suaedae]